MSCGTRGVGSAGSFEGWKEHVHEFTIDKLIGYDMNYKYNSIQYNYL